MKKIILAVVVALIAYAILNLYFLNRVPYICPIKYQSDIIIRNDSRGKGTFASSRRGNRSHRGIDLYAEIGTPVLAARSGRVAVARNEKRGMGNYVVIKHAPHLISLYGHLSKIYVKKNQFVRQGAVIGLVGKTGNANSRYMQPHLHFEIRENGIPQDPLACFN